MIRFLTLASVTAVAVSLHAMSLGVRLAMHGVNEGQMEILPELGVAPSEKTVKAALFGVADGRIGVNIADGESYSEFREWAENLEFTDDAAAKLAATMSSPNAWLSYALDTAGLIAAEPKEGDLVIEGFGNGAADGKFELVASVDGVSVGDGAADANLRKVFEVEGASAIMRSNGIENGFSADNVEISAAEPSVGKVKFTVTPKVEGGKTPDSFFFKVKMK